MESYLCYCCSLRPSARDLKTPFTRLGVTEIYSEMIEECFAIQLMVGNADCGICEECVDRLRDAREFILQVQDNQKIMRKNMSEGQHYIDVGKARGKKRSQTTDRLASGKESSNKKSRRPKPRSRQLVSRTRQTVSRSTSKKSGRV